MKIKTLRGILLFWCFFIGVGALWGGVSMFIDPTGVTFGYDSFFEGFQKLPFYDVLFTNLIFHGISLIIVNGLSQLFTAYLLLRRRPNGSLFGIICGVLLMLWICIQFVIFPFNWLSTAYFIFGLLEMLTALLLRKKEKAKE
ncbi:MAG: hypothetical protein GX683_00055 [Ruminococcaceae bacterium]|nr:hypothetical protein [Oscillospiraceae bacterium]